MTGDDGFTYDAGDLPVRPYDEPSAVDARGLTAALAALTIVCATIVAVVYLLTQ